jgi:phage baseplate assembly protein gpV
MVGPPGVFVPDYEIKYDALTKNYTGRIGTVLFSINGITGVVSVTGTMVNVTALGSANVTCGASSVSLTPAAINIAAPTVNIAAASAINLTAPTIGINGTLNSFGGPMDVKGALTVTGSVMAAGSITAAGSVSAPLVESQGKALAMHVHPYADSPSFVTPPYPTTQPPL